MVTVMESPSLVDSVQIYGDLVPFMLVKVTKVRSFEKIFEEKKGFGFPKEYMISKENSEKGASML